MAEETGSALADVLGVDPTLKPVRPAPAPGVVQPRVVPEDTGSARDLVLGKMPPTVTPPKDPERPFVSRGYSSLYDLPGELFQSIKRDLTPAFHLPDLRPGHWTDVTPAPYGPPPPATNLSPGAAGVKQGVQDVGRTIVGGLAPLVAPVVNAFIPGSGKSITDAAARVEEQRQADNAEFQRLHGDSNWASAGRIGGQFLATAPLLGPLGKAAQLGASYIPGAVGNVARFITGATPASSVVGRGGQLATEGAIQGGEFGALTSGQSDESIGEQVAQGAIGGAVAAPVVGTALGVGRKLAGVAGGGDAARAALAAKARDELGVILPVTPAAKTATSGTQMADAATRRDVQKLILKDMGENATLATPEVMEAAHLRLDQGFKTLAQQVQQVSAGGSALSNDMTRIARDLADAGIGADATKAVQRQMQDVIERFYGPSGGGQGQLSADGWLALTAKDGRLEKAIQNAPGAVKGFLIQIREALNDRLVASAGPDAQAAAQALRKQWRIMKTVEHAALPTGDISFNKFASEVERAGRRYDPISRQYAYDDQNRMNLIARVGREFLGTVPDSTTAARLTGSSLGRMAVDAATRAARAVKDSAMRSPWSLSNQIDSSLGQPFRNPAANLIPGTEAVIAPSVAIGAGLREDARRRQRGLLFQ